MHLSCSFKRDHAADLMNAGICGSGESALEALAFLDAVVENIPYMIFVKEARELRFVRFNRAGEELLGYPRAELIGKNDYDFFPKAEADFFTVKDREVLRSGKLIEILEEPIHTAKKGIRYLHTKKIPLYDNQGRPQFLLGISVDITDNRQAEFNELLSFTKMAVGREERMMELKREVNGLLRELERPEKYDLKQLFPKNAGSS